MTAEFFLAQMKSALKCRNKKKQTQYHMSFNNGPLSYSEISEYLYTIMLLTRYLNTSGKRIYNWWINHHFRIWSLSIYIYIYILSKLSLALLKTFLRASISSVVMPFGKRGSAFDQSGCWTLNLCPFTGPSLTHSHCDVTERVQILPLRSCLQHEPFCHFGHLGPGIIPADRAAKPAGATLCSSGLTL